MCIRDRSLTFSIRYPVTKTYDEVYPRMTRAFTLGGFTETGMHYDCLLYTSRCV